MSDSLDRARQQALPGATDHGEGVVSFSLYAPGKQGVSVIGDFNGWDAGADPLEERDGTWVTARRLEAGPQRYQFLVDGQTVICDPYAQAIEPAEGDDQPPRAVIDVSRPIYQWEHDNWQRPELDDLILAEVHVGNFTPEGTFAAAREKLGHLAELGVNAIEFMPLYEADAGDWWGYRPTYFLAPRRDYGSVEDLLALIDAAHGLGLAVIVDIVLNHTSHHHPFASLYPYEQSPWYGQPIGERNQFGLPTLDFRKDPTNAYVRDVQNYWLRVFHVDGFRYDYLAGIGADREQGQGLPMLMRTAREIRPDAYCIGEVVPEDPDMVNGSGLGAVWHSRCKIALTALSIEGEQHGYSYDDFDRLVKTFDPATQDYERPSFMINYLENHDEARLMWWIRQGGFEGDTALRKAALAATVLMTIPGEPMLWAGQEWGAAGDRSEEVDKLDWSALDSPAGRALHEHYCRLGRLRRSRSALRQGQFAFALVDNDRKCAVYHRTFGQADQVVVAVNFSPHRIELELPFPQAGLWRDFQTGTVFQVESDAKVPAALDPYSSLIFTSGVS